MSPSGVSDDSGCQLTPPPRMSARASCTTTASPCTLIYCETASATRLLAARDTTASCRTFNACATMRLSRAAGLVAALLLILAVTSWAQDFGGRGAANPLPCQCSDVDPRESFISTVPFTCWQQYKFGSCNQSFMLQSIKEVDEGYCQITCGRCGCCPTLTESATQAGLTEFVWAMNRSTSNVESLSQPGLMATVMAPDDNAMRTLINRLGGKAAIDSNEGVRAKLANIMSYHVVRPVEGYEAFTTPFMSEGVELQTFKNGSTITVESNTGGTITLAGATGSAQITRKEIYACKGFINVLNNFLLPPGESLSR